MKKLPLETKLNKIKEIVGETVVFRIGMERKGVYDLIDMKVIQRGQMPDKNLDPEAESYEEIDYVI